MERKWEAEERVRRESQEEDDLLEGVTEDEWIAQLIESERAGTDTPDRVIDHSLGKSGYGS